MNNSTSVQPQASEELRLALVMNGGVSLAVWMGGVTNEIFNLVKRRHPVYEKLLALTRSTARVDVISGTSAGGINGAALSLALLYGGEFSKLRDIWRNTGAFRDLLRPVLGQNPGSLLRGDEFFLPELHDAFKELAVNNRVVSDATPLHLRLTTTLLTGKRGETVDDLGVEVNDVDYRAQFCFRHPAEKGSDFDDRDAVVSKLARAARSTASFPFAFEPSLVSTDLAGHLKDARDEPLEVPRYVVDGGLLDNKPFNGALRDIFSMERSGCMRRVLAYVNPDPGGGPAGHTLGQSMPAFSKVIAESVFGIPQSQSISDQLAKIREHNETIRTRRDSVLTIAKGLDSAAFGALPGTLFEIYRARRLSATFDQFVYMPLPRAAATGKGSVGAGNPMAAGLTLLGKHGREQLKTVFMKSDTSSWLPNEWPGSIEAKENGRESWAWGLFPVEFAAKVMLDLLRRSQNLADYAAPTNGLSAKRPKYPPRNACGSQWRDPPAAAKTPADPSDAAWDAKARNWPADTEARRRRRPLDQNAVAQLWRRAYEQVRRIRELRKAEKATWDENTFKLLETLNEKVKAGELTGAALTRADFEKMFDFLGKSTRTCQCADIAYAIAAIVNEAAREAIRVALRSLAGGRMRCVDQEEAKGLLALGKRLRASAGDQETRTREVVHRLLSFEVIEFAFNDHACLESDAVIELAQFSGNAASPLGGSAIASKKLLGLQMAHFGAFYKESWRMNDWIYGRLDGAERLVRLLLDPARLHRFYFRRRHEAVKAIVDIGLGSVETDVLRDELQKIWSKKGYARLISEELAFLDVPDPQLPDALPHCAAALTERLHYGILRDELPQLLNSIAHDRGMGGEVSGQSEALLRRFGSNVSLDKEEITRPFSPEQARDSLDNGLIAREKLLDEAGSDLFTRTLTHTAGTLQNLLSSGEARLGPVTALFASLKVPILGFHFVAQGLTHRSRTSAALHGGLLAAGAALVCLAVSWSAMPAMLVTMGWMMLAFGVIASVARAPYTVGTIVLVMLIVAAVVTKGWLLGLVIAALMILMTFTLMRPDFQWSGGLQWGIGFATILVVGGSQGRLFSTDATAASQSSTATPVTETAQSTGILVLAIAVCLGLALAAWQSSPGYARVEAWMRARLK